MCDYSKREQAMVVVRPGVWCDPCLVGLVRALYENGFPTVASCCGHGKRPARISLADGRELFILPDFESAQRLSEHFTSEEADHVAR